MFTNVAAQNNLQQAFVNCQSQNNNALRQQGEKELENFRNDQNYPVYLFNFFTQQDLNSQIQVRAAIEFKQWFQKYSELEEYQASFLAEIVNHIKAQIFDSYIQLSQTNKTVGKFIEESIVYLAKREFPQNWDDLTQKITGVLSQTFSSQQNIDTSINVLKLVKKLTKKYEYSMRSDKLYIEIIHVCDTLHDTLMSLTQQTIQMLNQGNNQQGASQGMISLVKLLKNLMIIFYHLNFQDLHPSFEDNLNNWMQLIAQVLRLNIQPQQLNNDDIILFKCKGEALRGILLYSTKYRDEFMGLIKDFSSEIWNMCTITNTDQKFDKIVLNSLRYFKNLILSAELKPFFQSNMKNLLNSLVVSNLAISAQESEMFESEPDSFIETFFEQSDIHSRRSTTVELLKSLCKHYQVEIQSFIQEVIPSYIENLKTKGPDQQQEIILLNLVIDGSSVAFRTKDGTTTLSMGPELVTYFYNNVIKVNLATMVQYMSENQNNIIDNKFTPIYVSFYLRFFFYFRHFIPKNEILEITKYISNFVRSNSEALQNLTFFTVEMLLNIKEGDLQSYQNLKPYFNKDNVEPQIQEILQNFYKFIKTPDNELNIYSLRSIVVILQILKENCVNYVDALADLYQDQLVKICKGHDFQKAQLIFDGISILIFYINKGDSTKVCKVENVIVNNLNEIIQNSKSMSDLFGLVLQIYSQYVTFNFNNSPNQQNYKTIFESLMQANNWVSDNQSLFQAYIIFINSYVNFDNNALFNNIQNIQNILQNVCNLKYDQIFFLIADIVCDKLTLDQLRQSKLLNFILNQAIAFYQNVNQNQNVNNNTQKSHIKRANKPLFIKEFLLFVSRLVIKHGASEMIVDFDQISQGLLPNLYDQEKTLVRLVQNKADRRIIFIALSDLLLNNVSKLNQETWASLLNAIIENCGNRQTAFRGVKLEFTKNQTENRSDSGFYKLQAIRWTEKNQVLDKIKQVEEEDQYFGAQFKIFYQNVQNQNSINFAQILTNANQITLSKMVQ